MSNIADIAVYDGAATPVLHTLNPISVTREGGKVTALWREALTTVPVEAQVYVTATVEKLKSGIYKTEVRTVVPVMESVSGANSAGYTAAPKVAYENTMLVTGFFSPRSDQAGRRSVRQMSSNIVRSIWTSVAPVTSGPAAELFDSLISPT
jgi:hypothetical protein